MIATSPPLRYSLWASVWKLLRLRAMITWNNIRRARRRRQIGYGLLVIFIGGVVLGLFAASFGLLTLLRSPQAAQYVSVDALLDTVPTGIFTAAFLGLLITSFGVMLQALYLSGDMEFLLSAPVPIRAVFMTKLIQAILPNFGLVCLFGLPVLYGLGLAYGFSLLYYPLVLILFMALALAAAALSSLLVMSVVRVIPARRVAELLGFLGATLSFLCSQTGQIMNTFEPSRAQVSNSLSLLTRLNAPWSPLAWSGRGLMDIAQGRWLSGLGWTLLSLSLVSGVFFTALVGAERLYYSGWARVQVGTRRRRANKNNRNGALPSAGTVLRPNPVAARIPTPIRAIIAKDFIMLRRDLRNMSQLVTPLLFGVIYAFTLARTRTVVGTDEALPSGFETSISSFLIYSNIGLSLFISWTLIIRLAMMSFSQEGKNYWLLKTSPIRPGSLLIAKYIVAFIPSLLMGELFLLIVSLVQRAGIQTLWFGLVVIAFSIAGAVGVNLAFGVIGVNLNWENPRQMMRGTTGCLASLVSMGYMAFIVILFFGPPLAFTLLRWSTNLGQVVGLALGVPVSILCAVLPPILVKNRIPRIGE